MLLWNAIRDVSFYLQINSKEVREKDIEWLWQINTIIELSPLIILQVSAILATISTVILATSIRIPKPNLPPGVADYTLLLIQPTFYGNYCTQLHAYT